MHILDQLKQVCICCQNTAIDIFNKNLKCEGTIKYREYIKNGNYSKEIIVKGLD